LTSEAAQQFFAAVNRQAKRFMSDDHFIVDGTLIQARASQKSFRKTDGSDGDRTNFHGQKRKNDTQESTTDPDARLYKKSYGTESKLAYLCHALAGICNSLIAATMVTQADRYVERSRMLLVATDAPRINYLQVNVVMAWKRSSVRSRSGPPNTPLQTNELSITSGAGRVLRTL
jgi:hypothetical protein